MITSAPKLGHLDLFVRCTERQEISPTTQSTLNVIDVVSRPRFCILHAR